MDKIQVGDIFTISDETDVEQEVEVLANLTIEGTDYLAVSFLDDLKEGQEGDIDVFFVKTDSEGDLAAIETDEEFDKVSEAFDAILQEDEEQE
ncbi:DUF1292 domain-containing protein [Paraliobacillus quinghaiensis]|uniref:DUF1292 domain-containing protein n=1 Tax=Paraliobacillus quinghaiensis TaxID=470815 RepID=A0A917WPE1_9BACI|nr:DUF1292 domain-containing protein [Paraliobacillus quinghaiensis]GGM18683.1 DUF1292 domain-containing protein [Paraliobacillus quinghaiensis]